MLRSAAFFRGQLGCVRLAGRSLHVSLALRAAEKPRRPRFYEVRRLFALAKPVRWRLGAGVCLLAVSSTVSISVPFLMGRIMDSFLEEMEEEGGEAGAGKPKGLGLPLLDDLTARLPAWARLEWLAEERSGAESGKEASVMRRLRGVCVVLGGIFLVGAAANFGRSYAMITAGQVVTNRLRSSVYASILRQEIAFFDRSKSGELVNRLSNDVSTVGSAVTMNVSDGLRSLVAASAGTAMMVYVSPSLSVVGLSIVPPVVGVSIVYGRYIRGLVKRYNDSLAAATQVAEERISAIRTVRAFAAEAKEEVAYAERINSIMALARRDAVLRASFFGFTSLSGNAILLSILYAGGSLVSGGSLSLGSLSSFLLYAVYVGVSISGLSGFYSELMRGLGASTRLFELVDREPRIPLRGGLVPASVRGEVVFERLSFAYPERPEAKVLDGLSLRIPAGSVTAVVGGSGSGKSTLISLLLRFYEPSEGRILLDGADIGSLDPTWLRRSIGTVAQEPLLFSASIGENIAYGAGVDDNVATSEIEWAAAQANAAEFIRGLPDGLGTTVGEKGVMLSGGQRQRIAIARALVGHPKLLLLDEATSALDAESEAAVKTALEGLLKADSSRTLLLVAHRLSTVRNAHQIAVLAQGRVAELGTFDELYARPDGLFRQLVQKQTLSHL